MFYIKFCNFKINLVKASVAIGYFDLLSIIVSIVLDFKHLEKCEFYLLKISSLQLIYLIYSSKWTNTLSCILGGCFMLCNFINSRSS